MSLFKIAWRNIEQRSLASLLTALSMALGMALVVTVLIIFSTVNTTFRRAAEGFDLIVGDKGGRLDLLTSTVYHVGKATGTIPWNYYKEFKPGGRYAAMVKTAIPYCLGDNYKGFRVIGTVPELFDLDEDQLYHFAAGRNFEQDHFQEAVIGSYVAQQTGLKVGDKFAPSHGIEKDPNAHTHDDFKVVGVLAPTGTPNDRALFVNLEGFLLIPEHVKDPSALHHGEAEEHHEGEAHHDEAMHDEHEHEHADEHAEHEHEHEKAAAPAAGAPAAAAGEAHHEDEHHDEAHHDEHPHEDAHHDEHDHHHHHDHDEDHDHRQPLPDDQKAVSAILVRTRGLLDSDPLARQINEGTTAQAVFPVTETYNLRRGIIGPLESVLLFLAGLIVVVAGIGIMVSIYTSMSERRHDIAVMRSLGASRANVLTLVLLESILLSVGGGLAGFVLGHGLPALLNPIIESRTSVSLSAFEFATLGGVMNLDSFTWLPSFVGRLPCEFVLLPLLVVLASIVGYLPAMTAYRTDVAKALSASP